MNAYVSSAGWQHEIMTSRTQALTDEHRRITIHGDNDLICGHYQKDPQSRM